jgi:hypothetical protein
MTTMKELFFRTSNRTSAIMMEVLSHSLQPLQANSEKVPRFDLGNFLKNRTQFINHLSSYAMYL